MVEVGISSDARPGRGHGPETGQNALCGAVYPASSPSVAEDTGVIDAVLACHGQTDKFDVVVGGEVVCTSRDPEFDTCRTLAARGMTGPIRFWREGKSTWDSMIPDIERGAGMCTLGTKFGKYTPPEERFKKANGEGTESD
jgi:hypothetical protein